MTGLQKLADTYSKSLNVYLLAIEELIGFIKTENEINSSSKFKESSSFNLVKRDITSKDGSNSYDVMHILPISAMIPELAKLAVSDTFADPQSDENIILRRQVQIIDYSNSIIRYDRVKYLDFNKIDWDNKDLSETMERLSYRNTTNDLLKNMGMPPIISKLDSIENKDTLEWRFIRIIVALIILERVVDVSILANTICNQIKCDVY